MSLHGRLAISTPLPRNISYCTIDNEYWVLDQKSKTLSRVNPSASILMRKLIDSKKLSSKEIMAIKSKLPWITSKRTKSKKTSSDFNQDFLRKWAIKNNIPLFPTLEVDYACNLKCIHCYKPDETRDKLSIMRWKSLISELKDLGMLGVVITGGEPLIWPYFKELINHLQKLHSAFIIKTNGWFFDEAMASYLAYCYVHEVHFSLYGAKADVHDEITKKPGSFERVIRALRLCQKKGISTQISCIIMKNNIGEVDNIARIALQFGSVLGINPIVAPSASSNINYRRLRLRLNALREYCLNQPECGIQNRIIRMSGSPVCSAARSNCSIAPDGKVFPCNGFWYDCEAESISKRKFCDIWKDSPLLKKIRAITVDKLDRCFQCDLFSFCPRCLGLGYAETGEITGISPGDCMIAKCFHEKYFKAQPALDHGNSGSFSDRCY